MGTAYDPTIPRESPQRETERLADLKINLEPREDEAISRKLRKLMPELETKLVPHVKLAPKVYVRSMARLMSSDTIIKQGTMAILRDSQANEWDKCYFILKRYVPHTPLMLMIGHISIYTLHTLNVLFRSSTLPKPTSPLHPM